MYWPKGSSSLRTILAGAVPETMTLGLAHEVSRSARMCHLLRAASGCADSSRGSRQPQSGSSVRSLTHLFGGVVAHPFRGERVSIDASDRVAGGKASGVKA